MIKTGQDEVFEWKKEKIEKFDMEVQTINS